jgi:hypothetical protein
MLQPPQSITDVMASSLSKRLGLAGLEIMSVFQVQRRRCQQPRLGFSTPPFFFSGVDTVDAENCRLTNASHVPRLKQRQMQCCRYVIL